MITGGIPPSDPLRDSNGRTEDRNRNRAQTFPTVKPTQSLKNGGIRSISGGENVPPNLEGGQQGDVAFVQLVRVAEQKIGLLVKESANFHASDFEELADSARALNGMTHVPRMGHSASDAMKVACQSYVEGASNKDKAYDDLKRALFDCVDNRPVIEEPKVFAAMLKGFRSYSIESGRMKLGDYEAIKLRTYAECYGNPLPADAVSTYLGGGVFYSVDKISIRERDGRPAIVLVAKTIKPEGMDEGATQIDDVIIGGDPQRPLLEERNLATRQLDDALGFGVAVGNRLGYRVGVDGVGRRLLLMDLAQGKPLHGEAYAAEEVDFRYVPEEGEDVSSPEAQEALAELDFRQSLLESLLWDDEGSPKEGEFTDSSGNLRDNLRMARALAGMQEGIALKKIDGDIRLMRSTVNVPPFNNKDFRRRTTMLNYLDALTMQKDRQGDNYLTHVNPDGTCVVTGIDDDACFSTTDATTENLTYDDYTNGNVWRGTHLPHIADKEIYDAFCDPDNGMTPEKIQMQLQGLIPQLEIDKTQIRLEMIQNHLKRLAQEGRIIGMAPCELNWGALQTAEILCEMVRDASEGDSWTSYFGREFQLCTEGIRSDNRAIDFAGNEISFDPNQKTPPIVLTEVS